MQGETYHGTVDGQNPAPLRIMIIPLFTGFFLHPRWLFGISEPSTYALENLPRAVRLHD